MRNKDYPALIVETEKGGYLRFDGRNAWALRELMDAGSFGCTPIDNPAPRWSAYVFNLRHAGLEIETVHENHRGPFAGTHARYVLRTQLTVINQAAA